jgi:hypothetical protein
MTPTVVFENHGVLDPRAIKTFGISAKETKSPIGFFGTGLKYAIAVLLREGQHIRIAAGNEVYDFQIRPDNMRGKEFNQVQYRTEDGPWTDLPFTTDLGRNWEMWQAFREIYCNCLDENGSTSMHDHITDYSSANKTFVMVTGQAFYDEYRRKDEIVLRLNRELAVAKGEVDIYERRSSHVYYRGIRAMPLKQGSRFTFNIIDQMELTEDRTIKYPYLVDKLLVTAISKMTDKRVLRRFIAPEKDSLEAELNYHNLMFNSEEFSKEFMEVLSEQYNSNTDRMNRTARSLYAKVAMKERVKNYESEALTEVEEISLEKAKRILKQIVPSFGKYPLVVVQTLGEETHGLADMDEKTIVISKSCFRFGTKYVVATLMEEHMHIETGFHDMTRALQTYLFDFICTMAENHILKEPM